MITRTLLEYIQREQLLGRTRDTIVLNLKEKGWKDEDIVSAFKTLSDEGDLDVPVPQEGVLAEFREMLFLMWTVYRSRWKRFFGAGMAYLGVILLLSLAMFMLVLPHIRLFLDLVAIGDTTGAFSLAVPYLFLGICLYVLIELWYVGTLYSIALRKGDSLRERLKAGLLHLPAVLGIKVAIAMLLLIAIAPLFLVTFFTQNPLVFIVFGPFFVLGIAFLCFLFSLAIPAYFHGVSWKEASLHSMSIVWKKPLATLMFYAFFGALLLIITFLFRHTGIVAIIASIGMIFPLEVLFMIALYRRFATGEIPVSFPTPELQKMKEEKEEETLPPSATPSPAKRTRKTTKAPTA